MLYNFTVTIYIALKYVYDITININIIIIYASINMPICLTYTLYSHVK